MKKIVISLLATFFAFSSSVYADKAFDGKKLKEVKEWRIEGAKKKLDHVTKYSGDGKKMEEIEYTSVGDQKSRVTYSYNEKGKCVEEKVYDEYDKLQKTIQYEYFENGKKKSQKTLLPNGKLKSYKEFEYILE